MTFAMKFDMVDVIVDNSLRNTYVNGKLTGYRFDIRLNYYRGHFLSVIDKLEVIVDGEKVPQEDIRFRLHEKEFGICDLEFCYHEFWRINEPATIVVWKPGGLSEGEHIINIDMMFRSPYMAIGPNHQYMPVDNSGTKTLRVIF